MARNPAVPALLGLLMITALPARATLAAETPADVSLAAAETGESGDASLPSYLRDRGEGMRTSMFGTYVRPRELLVYTFGEYYLDNNMQYTPDEFGYPGTQDRKGRYRASEGLVFMSYGINDRLAVEMEAAVITASLEKDPADASGVPTKREESGLGDVEGQVTWTVAHEGPRRPEVFALVEAVIPHARDKALIGTSDWEGKVGMGATRGFGFATVSARISLEYARASETPWDLGEWGLEAVRRVGSSWRLYGGVEGQALDELALITEVQRTLSPRATLKIGTGIGLLANTTDFAPEVGIIFSFPGVHPGLHNR